MSNTDAGDIRIQNELSRMIDIHPNRNMTRSQWMTAIVMNLLLYGSGNSVVVPHTYMGNLQSLEPIAASRVQLNPVGASYRDYQILIDGIPRDPEDVLHFVYNPDPLYLWRGRGVTVTLRDIANNLKQAQKTTNAFMASEFKPSLIVKVDALDENFKSAAGRQKLMQEYVSPAVPGAPWIIPAEAFQVEQIKPLSLNDLAIKDTVELDKRTVAAVIGVPAFLLGVGSYNKDEWNNFISTRIRTITQGIQQELTRGLILSDKWYLSMNYWSLQDYDLKSTSDILLAGSDRGYVNGDEWRDRMHMAPAGLKEYRILENYIPSDMAGSQKKLVQE
jgi:HK97 family phage portal protein